MLTTKKLAPVNFRVQLHRNGHNGTWAAQYRQQTLIGPVGTSAESLATARSAVQAGIAAVAEIDRQHNDPATAPMVYSFPLAA